jgi:acylphosphatase
MKTVKTVASGHVQGVFFRVTAKDHAEALGLNGYARNLPDGNVEICLSGEASIIQSFLENLRKNPGAGHVDNLTPLSPVEEGPFSSFEIRY